MYFIYPSRTLKQLDKALTLFADLVWIKKINVQQYDYNQIFIADVHDFLELEQVYNFPTVVIALANEGDALSKAWQKGALAGWIWEDLPEHPFDELQRIDAQYKRNQDSRDLPAAAALQQKLLPHTINIPNYQFDSLFQPSAYLSGDWYDYWWVNDERVLFYLADVSGHGVTSSLLTSWMAAFHSRSESPKQFMTKLNSMLINENIEKHITMIAGLLDLKKNTITCCNAGHFPPAILITPDEEPKIFNSSSLPLGFTDDFQVEEVCVPISADAKFVICSDGALEPFSGGLNEQFNQLIQALLKEQFSLPDQVNDDIALLSLLRKA